MSELDQVINFMNSLYRVEFSSLVESSGSLHRCGAFAVTKPTECVCEIGRFIVVLIAQCVETVVRDRLTRPFAILH